MIHPPDVIEKYAPDAVIGAIGTGSESASVLAEGVSAVAPVAASCWWRVMGEGLRESEQEQKRQNGRIRKGEPLHNCALHLQGVEFHEENHFESEAHNQPPVLVRLTIKRKASTKTSFGVFPNGSPPKNQPLLPAVATSLSKGGTQHSFPPSDYFRRTPAGQLTLKRREVKPQKSLTPRPSVETSACRAHSFFPSTLSSFL